MAKKSVASVPQEGQDVIVIPAPKFKTIEIPIVGNAPYVQNAMPAKLLADLHRKHAGGQSEKNKSRKKEPKNFEEMFEQAKHQSPEGWYGIPSSAFRNAMVSACRLTGYPMTKAKLSVFIVADGYDKADAGMGLTRITSEAEPEHFESITRIQQTINVVARPLFKAGWEALVRVRWDTDQFDTASICNLMMRVGEQVGVGEGRPDSKSSTGMGWGTFKLNFADQAKEVA